MRYPDIVSKVSSELGLPVEPVDKAYKAYWLAMKNYMQSLPLKEELSEDNFAKLRTSFNIPSLGKLSVTYDRYLGVKKRFKFIQKIKDND